MKLNKLLSSSTFRFSLLYIIALSVVVTIILGIVYAVYSYQFTNEVHRAIDDEFNALLDSYQDGGVAGVDRFLAQRGEQQPGSVFFYLLVDEQQHKLAGTLAEWPQLTRYPLGWLSFDEYLQSSTTADVDYQSPSSFMGRSVVLEDGNRLLVARNYDDVSSYYRLVGGILIRGMIVTICMGAIGGVLVSMLFLRWIEAINRSIDTIMAGDLSERIEVVPGGNEFEVLVKNLNLMLERIESLMAGLKQVSDNIAHDLRTPLTRLRNHLSELEIQGDASADDKVQRLIDEADGILNTFNALLRIARIESNVSRSGFSRVSLNVLLQDVVEFYEPLSADNDQRLELAVAGEISLWADRDLFFQMLANLVDNAIKYTPAGGLVRVSARLVADHVRIEVADNGPGIPEAERSKAFQRFYRLEASRSLLPGNGLGLSLVGAVVKLHQGSIELFDNQPGLRVVVSVPLAKA
jgi:signal transduction histidine kinase